MSLAKRSAVVVAEVVLAAIVAWFAWRTLHAQWGQVRERAATLHPDWLLIAAASVLVLATYAMLVEVWRRMLHAWGDQLAFGDAARIWFVSSLGRYIPGKLWQVGAMGMMAQKKGVSPVAAGGSALLTTLLSILSGFAVVLLTGASALMPFIHPAGVAALVVIALGTLSAPWLLPRLAGLAAFATGRDVQLPSLPARAIFLAFFGSALAWVFYGLAFLLFTHAILGTAAGAPPAYISAYTASYLAGFLVLFAPGGVGVRELAMIPLMQSLGLASAADAALVAVTSRLWLTVLEILPGLLFLAGKRRSISSTDVTDAP